MLYSQILSLLRLVTSKLSPLKKKVPKYFAHEKWKCLLYLEKNVSKLLMDVVLIVLILYVSVSPER